MKKADIEKSLKRFLKRKVSYSFALLIAFMISGEIVSASGTENVNYTEETEMKAKDAKDLVSLFKILKNKTVVQKSEDKSTQFFFNVWLEKRKAKKYADNGFKEWGESNINPENPDIEIPDIITPIRPNIKDPESAIPNEDFIGAEPKFEFNPVGSIAMGEIPQDITINVTASKVPVSEIGDGDFNIFNKDDVSAPEDIEEGVGGIGTVPDLSTETVFSVVTPDVNYSGEIATFTPPEIPAVQVGTINAPDSFNLNTVNIEVDGVELDRGGKYVFNNNHDTDSIVQNGTSYKPNGETLNINISQNDLSYGNGYNSDGKINYGAFKEVGKNVLLIDGEENGTLDEDSSFAWWWRGLRKYFWHVPTATFISDITGSDIKIDGEYNFKYETLDALSSEIDKFVRVFLTVSPAGISDENFDGGDADEKRVKITEFNGTLNLFTDESEPRLFNGNLIGLKHQTYDIAGKGNVGNYEKEGIKNSTSVLLNNGEINLGTKDETLANKNMIGILIDVSEGTKQKQINSKTINANEINIGGTNNIGISYGQYKDTKNTNDDAVGFILRDDLYVGKVNVGGTNNYGVRMGNVFSTFETEGDKQHKGEYLTYFDKVRVFGNDNDGKKYDSNYVIEDTLVNIENGKLSIKDTDNDDNSKDNINYTSKILVSGINNAGLVVGKSLSSNASGYEGHNDVAGINPYESSKLTDEQIKQWLDAGTVNPIDNFQNISIEVNGKNNIGFLRDKNYSDNNKNDMVINGDNFQELSFGKMQQILY